MKLVLTPLFIYNTPQVQRFNCGEPERAPHMMMSTVVAALQRKVRLECDSGIIEAGLPGLAVVISIQLQHSCSCQIQLDNWDSAACSLC